MIFWPWHRKAKNIVKNVTAITGISDEAIKWARSKNNQDMQQVDKSFPLAYEDETQFKYDHEFLHENNLNPEQHHIYCFIGNLSSRYELDTVASAAKILQTQNKSKC